MNYRIIYTEPFLKDIDSHIDYLLAENVSPERILRWHDQLSEKLEALQSWPRLGPIDEAYSSEAGRLCRKTVYKDYLIFYEVNDDQRAVKMLAFIHGARRK